MIKPGNPFHRIKYTSYTDLPVIFFPKLCLHRDSILLFFLGPHPWHMEVSRLGVKLELHLLANTTATAMPDLSHAWDLHYSSQQRWIFNPLKEARDGTHVLMDTSSVLYHWAMMGTPQYSLQWKSVLTQRWGVSSPALKYGGNHDKIDLPFF